MSSRTRDRTPESIRWPRISTVSLITGAPSWLCGTSSDNRAVVTAQVVRGPVRHAGDERHEASHERTQAQQARPAGDVEVEDRGDDQEQRATEDPGPRRPADRVGQRDRWRRRRLEVFVRVVAWLGGDRVAQLL